MASLTVTPSKDGAAMLRLAQAVVQQIDGALHASVSVATGDALKILVSTDIRFDSFAEICDGPTVASMTTGRIMRIPTIERSTEFPALVNSCRPLGISSLACFPIKDASSRTTGVLTVSSADHHGFGTADLRAGLRVAEQLATELSKL